MLEEKTLNEAVVCFLVKGNSILLALKTRRIGKGYLNGYGGGVMPNESPIDAAVREVHEETNINPNKGVIALPENLEKIAEAYICNIKSDGEEFVCRVHFFLLHKWSGEITDTVEMIQARWYNLKSLPYHKMMPADKIFLPLAFAGKKVVVKAKLSPFQKELLGSVEITEVPSFSS